MNNKVVKELLHMFRQDLKEVTNLIGVLLGSSYVSSIIISCIVVFAQATGWIRLGVWEATLPFAYYWFWGHMLLIFVYYIYNRVSKAINNQK